MSNAMELLNDTEIKRIVEEDFKNYSEEDLEAAKLVYVQRKLNDPNRLNKILAQCEYKMPEKSESENKISDIKRLPMFLLCLFLGCLGIHRFYAGRIISGLFFLFSGTITGVTLFNLFLIPVWIVAGIWLIIDLIMILTGSFKDKNGKYIQEW